MMRIKVKVKPASKGVAVKKEGDMLFVSVKSQPKEGKANSELVEVLAEHFGVPKSKIRIVKGHKSRLKLVEIG